MTATRNPQLDAQGALHHLLTLERLPADVLTGILEPAEPFVSVAQRAVKKVTPHRGMTVRNVFS